MAADLVELLEAVAERIDFIAPGMAGWDDMTEGKICRKAAREIAELRQRLKDETTSTTALTNYGKTLTYELFSAEATIAELRQRERDLRALKRFELMDSSNEDVAAFMRLKSGGAWVKWDDVLKALSTRAILDKAPLEPAAQSRLEGK